MRIPVSLVLVSLVLILGSALVLSARFSVAEAQEETTAYAAVPVGQIEYVVSGPADGETVVFIPGGFLADAFLPIMRDPVLSRFQRVRIHLPGYMGSSDLEDDADFSNEEAVIAVLDALDVERAHLVGHSAGAEDAMTVAQENADRVSSLVIIDVGIFGVRSQETVEIMVRERIRFFEELSKQTGPRSCDGERVLEQRLSVSPNFGDDWRDFFTAIPGGWEQAVTDICRIARYSEPLPPDLPPPEPERLREQFSGGTPQEAPTGHPALLMWAADGQFAESMARAVQDGPSSVRGQEIANTDHALIVQKPAEIALMISGWLGANPIQ